MTLRVARHTHHLPPIVRFYCELLGLEQLGTFQGHDGYDGVFIGKKGLDWHLEFTISEDGPTHTPDEDDLLVFYLDSQKELIDLEARLYAYNVFPVTPRNPYWLKKGLTYEDPDGFRVVLSVKK